MTFTIQSYNFIAFIETSFNDRKFREILIDTNAVFVSIDEFKQLATLQRIRVVELRKFDFRSNDIVFDVDNIFVVDCVELNTSLKMIVFYIIEIDTSFLLSFADMNKLKAYFNNVVNKIVQSTRTHLVICKYDHAFILWSIFTNSFVIYFFESKLMSFERQRTASISS
jgi:hypothetical protein